jgi:hypothetical protein
MNLSLCGIGAQLRSEDGTAMIMEVIPGGPADRDKRAIRLTKGDKIIGVGQGSGTIEDIVHLPLNKAVRKIRGGEGTKVVLSVIPRPTPGHHDQDRRSHPRRGQAGGAGRHRPCGARDAGGRRRAQAGRGQAADLLRHQDKRPNQPGFRSATVDVAKQLAGSTARMFRG